MLALGIWLRPTSETRGLARHGSKADKSPKLSVLAVFAVNPSPR